MTLQKIQQSEFDEIYTHLENNFIPAERRDYAHAKSLLTNPYFTIYHVVEDYQNVGFVTVWELNGFDFIEHFVIYENYRNQGLGAKTLDLLKSRGKTLVLEAELAIDDFQKRRVAFYQRCKFVKNSFAYIQPPYRQCENGVPMVLMSYPCALDTMEKIVSEIYQKVYNVDYEKNTFDSQFK